MKGRFFLAPLEGVSDGGFRMVCHHLGARFTWTEMIRGSAIAGGNRSTLDLIDTFDNIPTGVQLYVRSPKELIHCLTNLEKWSCLSESAEKALFAPMIDVGETLTKRHRSIFSESTRLHYSNIKDIQLNFGCPSRDVIRDGGGPAMLKRKQKLTEIFQVMHQWKLDNAKGNSKLKINHIGCKIRLGLNNSEMNNKVYLNPVEIANQVGLDYIVVHSRHAGQKSSDSPYWERIKEIKEISSIPVIGNGDALTFKDALRMMVMTRCDGVMIARGAMKNPWIFKQLDSINELSMDEIENKYHSLSDDDSREYVPTLDELNEVERIYFNWIIKHPPNNRKCLEFHSENFRRIRKSVETSDFSIKVHNPSKIYV